jgi:hypothetical protein
VASPSAANAAAFYRQVIETGTVWMLWSEKGGPTARTAGGDHAVPFWSSKSRAERVVATVPSYAGYTVRHESLARWREQWLPDLDREGLRVGLNWSGAKAVGYDLDPISVEESLLAYEDARA